MAGSVNSTGSPHILSFVSPGASGVGGSVTLGGTLVATPTLLVGGWVGGWVLPRGGA